MQWRTLIDKLPASEVRTAETRDEDDELDSINVRGFLWTLFFFKMGTVTAIYFAARGSQDAAGLLLFVTTWPWLIIPGIVLIGWSVVRFRMRRVRARREALQRSEWMLDEHETMDAVRFANDRRS